MTPLHDHASSAGPTRVVAIGGSVGALTALRRLLSELPGDFPAAVLVAIHVAPDAPSVAAQVLDRAGPLPATAAEDGEPLESSRVYVAVPDRHLLVEGSRVRLSRGPRENRWRPAIDALLRSVAVHHGPRSVGLLLSGYLDDGVAGLEAIHRCGGITAVQDPDDAEAPNLPRNALAAGTVNHSLPLAELPTLLARVVRLPVDAVAGKRAPEPPADLRLEDAIARHDTEDPESSIRLGELVPFSCPDCGGPLRSSRNGAPVRYRCEVGHSFTHHALATGQADAVERSIWSAVRALGEQARLHFTIAEGEEAEGRSDAAYAHRELAQDAQEHAVTLSKLLETRPGSGEA